MPRVNIYIRNEDYEAWESIEAKPKFIHMSIVNYGLMGETASPAVVDVAERDYAKHVKPDLPKVSDGTLAPLVKSLAQTGKPPKNICKVHGTRLDDRGRCLQKGCKYA
jgi:hypothetical protein